MDERTCMIASSDYGFLWLDGVITPAVARMFQKCLDMMNRQECKAIILYIKGPGGDLWACSQMRNAIRASSRPVATVAHGRVGIGAPYVDSSGT